VTPDYLMRRDSSGKIVSLASQLTTINPGVLLQGINTARGNDFPEEFGLYWNRAQTNRFGLVPASSL
jgi:hypothetical protein